MVEVFIVIGVALFGVCLLYIFGKVFSYEAKMAQSFSWDQIFLECDSSFGVQLFTGKDVDVPWKFQAQFSSYLHFIRNIEFRISHIFQLENCTADILSKKGSFRD